MPWCRSRWPWSVVLLLGLSTRARRLAETSQRLMRWRVLLQAVALVVILLTIWRLGR
jgi:hypothetical protein